MYPALVIKPTRKNRKLPAVSCLRKVGAKILQKIPKYTGLNWKRKKLLVYERPNLKCDGILHPSGKIYIKSFIEFSSTYLLYILLHELVHLNLSQKAISASIVLSLKNHKNLEAMVSLVVKMVLIELFGKEVFIYIKTIDMKRHKRHEIMWKSAEKLERKYNLRLQPLSSYLLKKK